MKKLPKYYVFFDVDNTLVKIKTMRSFLNYFYLTQYKIFGRLFYKKYEFGGKICSLLGANREFLNRRHYKQYRGFREADIKALSKRWFCSLENESNGFYVKSAMKEIEKHQKNGAEIVFVSGSLKWCLSPIAERFGVKHILSTTLEVENGVCTGNILLPQTIGKGKVIAIKKFLSEQVGESIDLKHCYAYGDHISDLPMLNYVGNPHVIRGDTELESYAAQKGWPVLPNH